MLEHISHSSSGFTACCSFTIHKGVLEQEDSMIYRNHRCWIVSCLRAAVTLAADKGKINSEMCSVGRGICFWRVFLVLTNKQSKAQGLNCRAQPEDGVGMLVLASSGGRAGQVAVLQPAEAVGLLSRCHL